MYTRTENTPISMSPRRAARPPTRRVVVKAARMAMRMTGMKADERRMARPLASR
jgi:hypothetical protein